MLQFCKISLKISTEKKKKKDFLPGPDNGQTEIKPVRTAACLDCTQHALGCLFHQYIPQHDKIIPAFHPFVQMYSTELV